MLILSLLLTAAPSPAAAALVAPGRGAARPTTPAGPVATRPLGLGAAPSASAPADTATPLRSSAPALTARAAFAVDLTNQVELLAENADAPLPPASTTKIVTVLTAIEHADLDEVVTIEVDDLVDEAAYSHVGLREGDQVTVRDLLAGALIPSGGDAARALARYVGSRLDGDPAAGPRERFVAEMNRLAADIGMRNSHFENADGVDAPGHVTSARDLAIASAELFKHPVLEQLVAQTSATIDVGGPQARQITMWNTNELLAYANVHGVKTGTSAAAGQCLVMATWRAGARILVVVLGSEDRYADALAILDDLDQRFAWVRLGRGGGPPDLTQAVEQAGLAFMTSRTVLLTADQAARLRYEITLEPGMPGSPWKPRGEVVFFAGAGGLLRLPLYATNPP